MEGFGLRRETAIWAVQDERRPHPQWGMAPFHGRDDDANRGRIGARIHGFDNDTPEALLEMSQTRGEPVGPVNEGQAPLGTQEVCGEPDPLL